MHFAAVYASKTHLLAALIFWFFGQHSNEWQNESQSMAWDLGTIWNPIMSIFTESDVPPIVQEIFAANIFCGASNRTSPVHCYVAALSSCSSVKFPNQHRLLTTLGTLPVTTSKSERVFSKLQRTLTSIRSIMTED